MCQTQGSGCDLATGSSNSIWKQQLFKWNKVEERLNFPLGLMSSDFNWLARDAFFLLMFISIINNWKL